MEHVKATRSELLRPAIETAEAYRKMATYELLMVGIVLVVAAVVIPMSTMGGSCSMVAS